MEIFGISIAFLEKKYSTLCFQNNSTALRAAESSFKVSAISSKVDLSSEYIFSIFSLNSSTCFSEFILCFHLHWLKTLLQLETFSIIYAFDNRTDGSISPNLLALIPHCLSYACQIKIFFFSSEWFGEYIC